MCACVSAAAEQVLAADWAQVEAFLDGLPPNDDKVSSPLISQQSSGGNSVQNNKLMPRCWLSSSSLGPHLCGEAHEGRSQFGRLALSD